MPNDELLAFLFDETPHPLVAPMATWVASSRRFATFVAENRTKIRRKLHSRLDLQSLLDLRLELETAYLLLSERGFNLTYEPSPAGQTRGPDFAVTHASSIVFMVEVTRLQSRGPRQRDTGGGQDRDEALGEGASASHPEDRLADAVLGKLSQMQTGYSNILLIGYEGPVLTGQTVRDCIASLQRRAERNDARVNKKFGTRLEFFRSFQRLSELVVRLGEHGRHAESVCWLNPQARMPLSSRLHSLFHRSLRFEP